MYTWISRVLLLVFSFQVIAPQLVQAQGGSYGVPGVPPAGTGYSYRTMDVPTDSLEDKVRAVVERAKDKPFSQATTLTELDQMYNEYREELADLYDTIEVNNMADYSALYDVVMALHKLSDEYYPHLKKFQARAEAIAQAEERRRQMRKESMYVRPTIVNDATYVAPSASGQLMTQQKLDFIRCSRFSFPTDFSNIEAVLDEAKISSEDLYNLKAAKTSVDNFPKLQKALKNAGLTIEDLSSYLNATLFIDDLVEGIDPFPEMMSESSLDVACAAEMLIHTIDEQLSQSALSEEDTDFWTDYLPRLSARMQYKYYRLPDVTSSPDPSTIMLVGS